MQAYSKILISTIVDNLCFHNLFCCLLKNFNFYYCRYIFSFALRKCLLKNFNFYYCRFYGLSIQQIRLLKNFNFYYCRFGLLNHSFKCLLKNFNFYYCRLLFRKCKIHQAYSKILISTIVDALDCFIILWLTQKF